MHTVLTVSLRCRAQGKIVTRRCPLSRDRESAGGQFEVDHLLFLRFDDGVSYSHGCLDDREHLKLGDDLLLSSVLKKRKKEKKSREMFLRSFMKIRRMAIKMKRYTTAEHHMSSPQTISWLYLLDSATYI